MSEGFKKIEEHLFQYKNYKIGLKHMQRQLDCIYPRITATYDEIGGGSTGAFQFKSQTEDVAIKRVEKSRHLLELHKEEYELVIRSIEEAINQLDKMERRFVELRYFQNHDMESIAAKMKYSNKRSIYKLRDRVGDDLYVSLKHLIYISL